MKQGQELWPYFTPAQQQERCDTVEASPAGLVRQNRPGRVQGKCEYAAAQQQQPSSDEMTVYCLCAEIVQTGQQANH